jgi:hypothetical protein
MLFEHEAVILFLALFALSSPVAALSSYLPIVRPYSHVQQLRLAVGLAVNVAAFVLVPSGSVNRCSSCSGSPPRPSPRPAASRSCTPPATWSGASHRRPA